MRFLALLCLSLAAASLAAADIGKPAPPFTLTDHTGNLQSLADHSGKWVVLEWINHDCPFVKKHYNEGHMQKLQAEITGAGGVWLTINSSAPGTQGHLTQETAASITAEKNAKPTAVLLDPTGATGKAYAAKTTPHMYLISPEGLLVYQGAIDSNNSAKTEDIADATNYITQAWAEVQAGKPVSVPETQAYGCSLKYAK